LDKLLNVYEKNSLLGPLCGYVFQSHSIKELQKGGKFKIRDISSGRKGTLDLPCTPDVQLVDDVERGQPELLHVPTRRSFPGLDCWRPKKGGFQMTIAESHGIHSGVPFALQKLGPNGNKLYWVVSPRNFDTFTAKEMAGFRQYVLLMENPPIIAL